MTENNHVYLLPSEGKFNVKIIKEKFKTIKK